MENFQINFSTSRENVHYSITEIFEEGGILMEAKNTNVHLVNQVVQCIMDLTCEVAVIQVDFADVQAAMKDKEIVYVGKGVGKGEENAIEAIKTAISSLLLETTIESISDVIFHLRGDVSILAPTDVISYIQDMIGADVNIVFGLSYDESQLDTCRITVIATGIH